MRALMVLAAVAALAACAPSQEELQEQADWNALTPLQREQIRVMRAQADASQDASNAALYGVAGQLMQMGQPRPLAPVGVRQPMFCQPNGNGTWCY